MKCDGLFCINWKNCPLKHRPVEELAVQNRVFECQELVALYLKFVEIGLIKKEEKENES